MPISTIGTNSLSATAQIGSLTTASGSAPSYSARAWVNFNGTGTVAIRASGNVTSITDNGTGDYTVNFTTALADANYSVVSTTSSDLSAITIAYVSGTNSVITTSSVRLVMATSGGAAADRTYVGVAIFR